jgi:hypothetical protein
MCLTPSAPQDNSGALAQQAQNARESQIRAADSAIDQAFSGFDDNFYINHHKAYVDAQTPLADEQYNNTRKQVALSLARTGNLSSSYGINTLADVDKQNQTNLGNIESAATDSTRSLGQQIQNNKSILYSLASSASDPSQAAAQAPIYAAGLDTPVGASPLGDLFSQFAGVTANAIRAEQNGYYGTGTGLFAPSPSGYVHS